MKLLVSALEPSANAHLAQILKHIDCEICGIFDHKSFTRFKPLYSSDEFGIMGVVDALKIYKKARKALYEMVDLSASCDGVLVIDSPAFNIPLGKHLHKKNPSLDIYYYILPQVWAWKAKRIKVVENFASAVFCILPFETQFWKNAVFVGHPLMHKITSPKTSYEPSDTIAFLPGSRRSEIAKLMPIFRQIASETNGKKLLAVLPSFKDKIAHIYGNTDDFDLRFDAQQALKEASKAVVCSGTASLEAAVIGTPFVLVYKAKWLDYVIAKSFLRLPFVGLANVIFYFLKSPPIHPELVQFFDKNDIKKALEKIDTKDFLQGSFALRKLLKSDKGASLIASYIKKDKIPTNKG